MIISEELQATLDKATELVDWIIARLNGIEIKRDDRHRVPSMLFDLVIEHHISIAQLLKLQLCASAFTLVRCEFESFVRGSWLHYCATDKQLESFVEKDHLTFNFREMIEALEQKPQFAIKYFSTLRDQYWNSMNSYTHGGMHQVVRRLKGEYIEPNFKDAELCGVAQFSSRMALFAFFNIAKLAGRGELSEEISAKFCSDF